MLQHLEGGQARGLLRFAIVGITNAPCGTRAALAQDICIHVVTRHAVRRTDLLEKRQRLFLGLHMGQAGDEAAFLLLDLGDGAPLDGGVRAHSVPNLQWSFEASILLRASCAPSRG